jgi:predicted homoserine dehydrogenase-like protein
LKVSGEERVEARIGVVGTGFISRHFVMALEGHSGFGLSRVLTRRPLDTIGDHPARPSLTNSVQELLESSDVVLECSGDPLYATEVIDQAVRAGRPVVTMNAEFHVTAGSYFAGRGLVTEAEGDQPGCQAALREEALELGFQPLVYGNMKGFLNHIPTREEMEYWGARQGISLPMVTSFTDGTKVQMEQALVANGCGATIARTGLLGPEEDDLQAASAWLAGQAEELGSPISDYVLSPKLPHGVFIVARHDTRQRDALSYLKLGEGPFYVLIKNNIFVFLEIMKTIKRVLREGRGLLDNSARPQVSVAALAKREIRAGTRIEQGIGSFDLRGEAVRIGEHAGHLPIGLVAQATITRRVRPGDLLGFDDVDLPETLALQAWRATERLVLAQEGVRSGEPA